MSNTPRRLRAGLTAALALALIAPASAPAQEERADTAAVVELAPVMVRVARRAAALERLPFSVSLVTPAATMGAYSGMSLEEVLRAVPGVQVDDRFNDAVGERITIRGFGARSQFGIRGVRIVVDGIPATLPDGQSSVDHLDLTRVARAEVIRGAAGMLYGNAAGGVLRIEYSEPPPIGFRQEAAMIARGHGTHRASAVSHGSVGSTAYAAAITRQRSEGFRRHSDSEKLHLNVLAAHDGARDSIRLSASFTDLDALNPGALSREQLEEDPAQAHGFNVAQRTRKEARHGQAGVTWRRPAGPGGLEAAAYVVARSVANPIPTAIIDLERRAGGARLLYAGPLPLSLSGVLGVEIDAQRDGRRNFANEAGDAGALELDQRERVRSLGAFAQVMIPLTPDVSAWAGARADAVRFAVRDRFIEDGDPDDSGERRMHALSPSVGTTAKLSDRLTLFATLATGFETPTTTELANRPEGSGGFNPGLDPERTLMLEVGARGRPHPAISYQLAAFRARVRDKLTPFEVADAPGRTFFRNAGSALHRGLEAELGLNIGGRVHGSAAYTWLDARFQRFRIGEEVFDDNRIPGVGPHRIDARVALHGAGGWLVALDARAQSATPVDDANSASAPRYALLAARAQGPDIVVASALLQPYVGVANLLDRAFVSAVTVNAFGGRFYEPGPPRTLHAGVSARWPR